MKTRRIWQQSIALLFIFNGTLQAETAQHTGAHAEHEHHQHEHHQHEPPEKPEKELHQHSLDESAPEAGEGQQLYTCSMHPHIRLPKPGKCPICHMDLIPLSGDAPRNSVQDGTELHLEPSETALMEIETASVERRWIDRKLRLLGQLDYDESRLKHITAWVPGRIERMFVDFTGIQVQKGDHMVSLFSPELLSAQEELIQAKRAVDTVAAGSSIVARSTRRTLEAARDKLKLLGLTAAQVTAIEKRGSAKDTLTIYAPIGGTVVEKQLSEGMYVQTGTRIYTIADLGQLWLQLEAYESDLVWLRYGQQVEFSAEALPGERFRGVVSFIQPLVNPSSRTVAVRVNVENPSGRLKPGMFVTASIHARLDASGEVVSPSFAGQYVCPMHPEVVDDKASSCPICGMELVPASSLPFVKPSGDSASQAPLVIPASAPLITGDRAIVYVKEPEKLIYRPREIVLGPRAGEHYLVTEGLREGEQVVSKGAFKIDADLQIRGARSMMNPEAQNSAGGAATHAGH